MKYELAEIVTFYFMAQRIKEASPEELERIKERMRQFGMSDERIDEVITRLRGNGGSGS